MPDLGNFKGGLPVIGHAGKVIEALGGTGPGHTFPVATARKYPLEPGQPDPDLSHRH